MSASHIRDMRPGAGSVLGSLTGLCLALTLLSPVDRAEAADTVDKAAPDEVVITAERHKSTVQDTPISITAISGDQLAAQGLTSVEDVAHQVPGLSMRSAGPGQTEYEARGLASSGGAAPTVGFYLNDIPLSPPAAAQVGKVVIDPDLYDINHIEVLRGPQGTLYGSGSMGGTVRVVTNQPKLDIYEGSVEATASGTDGGGANGGANAMINIPIDDKLALRLVGSDKYRSGWIDRIVLNPFPIDSATRGNVLTAPVQSVKKAVNTEKLGGGRAGLLYQATDDLTITGDVLYQALSQGGYDEFDSPPGSSHLAHYEAANIKEPISDIVKLYSLTAVQNFGFATLTSATAYWNREEKQTQDASESISYTLGLPSYVSIPYTENDQTRQFSEEIRLSSPEENARLRWTVGGFYSDLHSTWIEQSNSTDPLVVNYTPPGSNPTGTIFNSINPYRTRQFAAFGDGSINITDEIKFATGLRWFRYMSILIENEWGNVANSLTQLASPPHTTASASGVTPRFDLSYSPSKDLTVYATASQGFRPGGANQIVPANLCGPAPLSFSSDSVWNYEVGEKAKLFDNRVTVNGDFYYIRWSGIQQTLLLTCGYQYYDNAGNGRSFGPELEVNAKITPEWSVAASGTYTDSEITSPSTILAGAAAGYTPSCTTVASCTLPILNVPKYTGTLSLVYSHPIGDYLLTARVTNVYTGTSTDESYYPIINLPAYDLVNLRVGLTADKWSASLFANNLTNKRAAFTANNTSFQFNIPGLVRYSTNQPLTAGVDLSYHF